MPSVSIRGYSPGDTGYSEDKTNPNEYVFILPRSSIESASSLATSLEIHVDYTVLTGSAFESAGLDYSNYKIIISAELVKTGELNDPLLISQAENFLIYTNARIYPGYMD